MRVINLYKASKEEIESCVYVGRNPEHHQKKYGFTRYLPELANPFEVGKHGERGECIDLYHKWLINKVQKEKDTLIINAIMSLKDTDILACWCLPKACHCDIIIRAWKYLKRLDNS